MAQVLVVDDTEDARLLLAKFMECEGHEVATAMDGRDALDQMERTTPDFVLLDLMMPRMDGLSFLEFMRDDPRWAHVRVIVFTGFDLGINTARLKELHVIAVLVKGATDLKQLAAMVRLD